MMTMGAMGASWGGAEKCFTFWNSLRGEEDLDTKVPSAGTKKSNVI